MSWSHDDTLEEIASALDPKWGGVSIDGMNSVNAYVEDGLVIVELASDYTGNPQRKQTIRLAVVESKVVES